MRSRLQLTAEKRSRKSEAADTRMVTIDAAQFKESVKLLINHTLGGCWYRQVVME